jgi:hypothetical protein
MRTGHIPTSVTTGSDRAQIWYPPAPLGGMCWFPGQEPAKAMSIDEPNWPDPNCLGKTGQALCDFAREWGYFKYNKGFIFCCNTERVICVDEKIRIPDIRECVRRHEKHHLDNDPSMCQKGKQGMEPHINPKRAADSECLAYSVQMECLHEYYVDCMRRQFKYCPEIKKEIDRVREQIKYFCRDRKWL